MSGIGSIGSIGGIGSLGGGSSSVSAASPSSSIPSTVVSLDNSLPNKQVGINLYNAIQNSDSLNVNLVSKETGLPLLFISNFIKTNVSEEETRELTEASLILLLLELMKKQQLNNIINM